MNVKRLLIALGSALLLSLLVTWFLNRRITAHAAAVSQHAMVKYVAAAKALAAGSVLKPEDLALQDWPASVPLSNGFKKPEEISGRTVIYPVAEHQPILESSLAAPGSGIGLTGKIAEGMRAISVHSDEVVGVAGFLFPGSHVDVLVTFREGAPTPATQIVLQDVEVLTAGKNIEPDPQGKPQDVAVVTLLLKPEDAEKLVLAATQGTIHFVLRNGSDRGQVKASAVSVAQLIGTPPPAVVVPRVRIAPAKTNEYGVETIIGTKRSTKQF